MRKMGWILTALLAFSCRKDACEGVACERGFNCENGDCVCTSGTAEKIVVAGGVSDQTALALAADPFGNVLYFGEGTGKTLFGNDSLVIGNTRSVYRATINAFDSVVEMRVLAPSARFRFSGVFSTQNHTLVYGSWNETGLFDATTLSALDGTDGLMARINAAGAVDKTLLFGGGGNQTFTGAFENEEGNVYLVGTFADTLVHEGGMSVGVGGRDAFVLCVNNSWNFRWLRTFGGAGDDEPAAVFQDSDGDVHVWTTVSGDSIRFISGDSLYVYGGLGQSDAALVSFARNGDFKRATLGGGSGRDRAVVAALASDGLYLGGSFQNAAAFGAATVTSTPGGTAGARAADTTFFVAKSDFFGRFRWATAAPGEVRALAVAPTGNLYAAGVFYGVTNFGGFSLAAADPGLGEIFMAVLDAKGAVKDAQRGGGPGADVAKALVFAHDGRPRLAADAYNARVHDETGVAVFNNADFGAQTLVAPFPNRRFAFFARLCRTL